MMWVPLLFFLGAFFSGSRSQLVLTQPPSVAEALGSTVRISCALNSGHTFGSQRVRWYQQQYGGVPRFIYHYRFGDTEGRGSGVPERFTVSPDPSNDLWYLVITGIQAEDDADYYCSTWDGSRSQLVVTQPLSIAKAPGSTVMIPCALSSGYTISTKRGSWYQQKSGGVPLFLYHYYTSSDQGRGSGIPERFTISPDTSNNLWNLVITGVQAEDDADYYCMAWDEKLSSYHCDSVSWGTETKTSHL